MWNANKYRDVIWILNSVISVCVCVLWIGYFNIEFCYPAHDVDVWGWVGVVVDLDVTDYFFNIEVCNPVSHCHSQCVCMCMCVCAIWNQQVGRITYYICLHQFIYLFRNIILYMIVQSERDHINCWAKRN